MSKTKSVLIVTDGTDKIAKTADNIAHALKGHKVLIKDASAFKGTDLLQAEAFFIGCEVPSPQSFAFFDEMLQHINLADRNCGIFSSSKKAAQYLAHMVKSSEAKLYPESLDDENPSVISKWAAMVIDQNGA